MRKLIYAITSVAPLRDGIPTPAGTEVATALRRCRPTVTSLRSLINTSLDGFIEDAGGAFDWSVPTEDMHRYYNDLMAGVGTQLLGRRMYETMLVWETDPSFAEPSPVLAEFATAWRDTDKIVYSTTLAEPRTKRTRIAPAFDAAAVRALKDEASADLLVGGPALAAHALRAGLVDECAVVVVPVVVGSGKPAFAPNLRLDLELIGERRFSQGAVLLRYRARPR